MSGKEQRLILGSDVQLDNRVSPARGADWLIISPPRPHWIDSSEEKPLFRVMMPDESVGSVERKELNSFIP